MVKIRDIMTSPVITIGPDATVKDATALLAEKNVSGAPVVDDGKIVGIFSEADVLRSLKTTKKDMRLIFPSISSIGIAFQEQVTQREILEAYEEIGHMRVRDVMSKDVKTVESGITVNEAIVKMVSNGINRLPVIEDGALVGIVTRGDVIKGLAKETVGSNGTA
ncbi:MAG TPA: CBS domain-containing protein [Thermoplasmata archaeon]|nr:CBS domain-containing protein [Thermoplasmata archaeon]